MMINDQKSELITKIGTNDQAAACRVLTGLCWAAGDLLQTFDLRRPRAGLLLHFRHRFPAEANICLCDGYVTKLFAAFSADRRVESQSQ